MAISSVFIKIDQACDWIPVVSTISNLTDLFFRSIPSSCLAERLVSSRYWEHIQRKEPSLWLFIPGFNVVYCLAATIWFLRRDIREIHSIRSELLRWSERSNEELQNLKKTVERDLGQEMEKAVQDFENFFKIQANDRLEKWCHLLAYGQQFLPASEIMREGTIDQKQLYRTCFTRANTAIQSPFDLDVNPNFYCGGDTPLLAACRYGNMEIIKILLEKGANPSQPSFFGALPVAVACGLGHLEVVQYLFSCSDQKNSLAQIRTILPCQEIQVSLTDIAYQQGNLKMVEFFKSQGAPPPDTSLSQEQFLFFFSLCADSGPIFNNP